jgi:hypothetical protein
MLGDAFTLAVDPAIPRRKGTALPLAAFVAFHLLLLASGVTWAALRVQEHRAERLPPQPRNEPLRVLPLYNEPALVSDSELIQVLHKLRPRLRGRNPKMNHVDHALRFWGIEARFADPECLSGVEMRELLLDHRQFAAAWKPGTQPFLTQTEFGVRPRLQEGDATASHVDHTLATLAEVGTPLDYPVLTSVGETRVRALLMDSLRAFGLNQTEYEWSAVVFSLYLPQARPWLSREGQWIDYDRIAERIMRQEPTQGVCFGNHRLQALVTLLQVDEQQRILGASARQQILDYLRQMTALLVRNQDASGFWDGNWDGSSLSDSARLQTPLARRILATGHALEWWALAPASVQPPLSVRVQAAQWLCRTIENMSDREIEANYTFLSHAGRALALWRGKFPAEVLGDKKSKASAARP